MPQSTIDFRGRRGLFQVVALAALCAFLTGAQNCKDNLGKSHPGPTSFRISIAPDTVPANGASSSPSFTTDGRFACFASRANNLAPPQSGFQEIFLRDRQLDKNLNLTQLSLLTAPAVAGDCANPYMTANGKFVVFESKADLALLPGVNATKFPAVSKLFFMNLTQLSSGTITILPLYDNNPLDPPANQWEPTADCTKASISEDGRFVVFQSVTTVPSITQTTPPTLQVYVQDLQSVTLVPKLISHSTGSATMVCDREAVFPRISGDDSTVVFHSLSQNLTADPNPLAHSDNVPTRRIYASAPNGTGMTLVSRATDSGGPGAPADNHCGFPSVSNDGRFVAFAYQGGTMIPGTTGLIPIARRDRTNGITDLVATDGFVLAIFISYGDGDRTGISADGRFVSYTGINPTQTDLQIRVRDMMGGTIGASHHVLDPGTQFKTFPNNFISADGNWVAWESDSSIEVVGDTNGVTDVFGFGPVH